jgi:peptide/nickel transport system ATP-binding protein
LPNQHHDDDEMGLKMDLEIHPQKSNHHPIVLDVKDLELRIPTYEGTAQILNGVNLTIREKEILGLVGETGSGKTMTALAVTGLIKSPPAEMTARAISFHGESLLGKSDEEMRKIRARNIAMVFQDPTSNLSPVLSIGEQMIDVILCRQGHGSTLELSPLGYLFPDQRRHRRQAQETAINMLQRVGIDDPKKRLKSYPHEFSGGMKQRTLIAMALAGSPELFIADEPTTALDVSVEAQILELVRELVRELGLSVLWVTHNLGVVWKLCTDVAVMYSGAVVERCSTETLFAEPLHPYTLGLLKALPTMQKSGGRLLSIPGTPPNPIQQPPGCRFHPRCPIQEAICREKIPDLIEVKPGHFVACHIVARPL